MADDPDKLNRFEEAFQRGQQGRVSNYEAWLQDNGINPENTAPEFLTAYFQENTREAVNHDEPLEDVAEYLGFFSRRADVYHLPVIGVSGIGKTQFLHTVSDLLSEMGVEIEQRFFDAESFGTLTEDEARIFAIRDDLRDLEKVVVYIDNCEWERSDSLTESFRVLEQVVDDALLISSWTPEYWTHHREDIEEVLPASNEIHLTRFSEAQTVEAVARVFEVVADDGLDITEEFLTEIYRYSSGIPRVFTLIALETLKETFLKELDIGNPEAVEAAADKLNLVGLEETVYDLSDTKLTILTHMLLSTDRDGIRPSQLVDLLDRDKSTVSYHLQDLTAAGVVDSEKRGRSAYYRVKYPVEPVIQNRINQNGEFHGEL